MLLLCSCYDGNPYIKQSGKARYELVALNNSSTMKGAFFLGCGRIEDELTYVFYIKDLDGAIFLYEKYAYRCVVYEDVDRNGTPYAIIPATNFGRYELHIPEDSIVQNYELDLSEIR